ncbi:MAG: type II toxin-antitoxin system VapC family toxin [Ectothiorhodospiraceae bacterium]|nr:type II toxin-antitoxin system VapC family toxin [Ectothiorhodospiraceae bacterium]
MLIMVDTSIWVDFFRGGDADLEKCLQEELVLMHPMVVGELSLGYLRNRTAILKFLGDLSSISPASHEQVMAFVETHQLVGRGIGWVDAHLLTAVSCSDETQLWTRDKRLRNLAQSLNLASPLN